MAGQAQPLPDATPRAWSRRTGLPYAQDRYRNEVGRLYSVLDHRLADREFVAGDYSIADMAIWPWARGWENQQQDIDRFPHMQAWLDRIAARPAVETAVAVGKDAPLGRPHPRPRGAADPLRPDRDRRLNRGPSAGSPPGSPPRGAHAKGGESLPERGPALPQTLTLRRPDDWHLHLRDGAMLAGVLPASRHFARAIVMPNLVPPVVTARRRPRLPRRASSRRCRRGRTSRR